MDNIKELDNLEVRFDICDTNVIDLKTNKTTEYATFDYHSVKNRENELTFEYEMKVFEELKQRIERNLIDEIYVGAYLFLIDSATLENMALSSDTQSKTRLFFFDGFLAKDDLNDNPNSPSVLQDNYWSTEINNKKYSAKDITVIHFALKSNDTEILEDFKNKFPYDCQFEIRNQDLVFVDFDITINDLIMLHKDLEILENQILSNKPIEKSAIKARQGVSQKKLLAKELAKHIAETEWEKDKDNKIKITDMASMVYAELYVKGFIRELPKDPCSLKDWIKDIAPPYAQTGGRPQKDR